MPRTGLSPEQIKTRAMQIALEQIRAHGFERVRLTEIAQEMGISHAALYSHFVNREALLDSVLGGWLAETTGALEILCESSRKPRHKLEDWFLMQYRMKRDRARNDRATYAAFVVAAAARKAVACAYLEIRRAQLSKLLEQNGLPRSAAQILLDGMAGFLHPQLILEHADRDREAELKRVLDTLLRGISAS